MSGERRRSCEQQLQTGAYVLGALCLEEAERYREHLEGCAICRGEVADLQPVVDALSMSAPAVAAPRRLRERVMAIVRAEADPAQQAHPTERPATERPATERRDRSARLRPDDADR